LPGAAALDRGPPRADPQLGPRRTHHGDAGRSRSDGLRTEMLADPALERNVFLRGRGVTVPTGRTGAQQLRPDGIAPVDPARSRHAVPGAKPAVAVAVKQYLARQVGAVRARGMPQPPVKEHRGARSHTDGCCAGWLRSPVRRILDLVLPVA